MQDAAQTHYDYAKDTASNLADKAQGHAQDAHGQAKVRPLHSLCLLLQCFCPDSISVRGVSALADMVLSNQSAWGLRCISYLQESMSLTSALILLCDCLQDTLGSASDKADHHATQASKQGQSYLDSAKDQANQLFGQGKVRLHHLKASARAALKPVAFV